MTVPSTASSTKMPSVWYFSLSLPVVIKCIHNSPNVVFLEGVYVGFSIHSYACSLARKLNGLAFFFSLSRSLARSVSLIAQRICSFLFQPISVRCCRRRSFANVRLDYRGVRRSKQTNREGERERERKKIRPFLYFLSLSRAHRLSHFLIFSKYNIQSGQTSFLSHSLAHIFKHRRRRPSSFMSFLLSPFFLFCSLGRHRITWGSHTIIVHVVDAATTTQQTTSYISFSLYIIIYACIHYSRLSIFSSFQIVDSHIYIYRIWACVVL